MSVVAVERVEVSDSAIDAMVFVEPAYMRTDAHVAARALELLPGLARHSCKNDDGSSFVVELRDTETAHLLEHVACELMALAGSPRSLHGQTAWDFARDGAGRFRIRLEYDDDLVALGALREGAAIVEWLFGDGGRPDVSAGVERLQRVRGVPGPSAR